MYKSPALDSIQTEELKAENSIQTGSFGEFF
jgi:hypothetical protein